MLIDMGGATTDVYSASANTLSGYRSARGSGTVC
jgi:cell division ATPase FtsA